jgi:hypothetical protein
MAELEKNHRMTTVLELSDSEYGQIMAKADHDNCRPEEIIQAAVDIYLEQLNQEKLVIDADLLIEIFETYIQEGITPEILRKQYSKMKNFQ